MDVLGEVLVCVGVDDLVLAGVLGVSIRGGLGEPCRDGFGVELLGPLMATSESSAMNSTLVECTWEFPGVSVVLPSVSARP